MEEHQLSKKLSLANPLPRKKGGEGKEKERGRSEGEVFPKGEI